MGEHRVPSLNSGLRRYPDPERSPDPRVRAILTQLRELEVAPAPRAHFRAELRAQLVAVAPRLVAEGVTVETPAVRREVAAAQRARAARTPARVGVLGRLSSLSLGRPVAVVTTVVAIFAALLGSVVWASKSALPGDPLYGLKRANENVQLSLTSGTDRGKTLLSFASKRAGEVNDLLSRATALAAGPGVSAAGGISSHTASLVTSTLNAADDDLRSASQLFGGQAVQSRSAAPLLAMQSWTPGQLALMQQIVSRVPAGPLHDRALASELLVTAAQNRAEALQSLLGCSCLAAAPTDELGPVPCTVCNVTSTLPTLPTTSPTLPGTPSSKAHQTPTPTATQSAAGSTGAGSPSDSGSGSGSSSSGQPTISLPTIPSLPVTLPTLPTLVNVPSGTATCLVNLLGICVKI